MTDYVLTGLVKRRAELSGEGDALRAKLTRITTDLGHLDAVIRQFDPEYDMATIRPKRPRSSDAARPGEMSRFVLGALRDAVEPMGTPAIAAHMMAERGMDGEDRKLVRDVTKRVGMALGHQEKRGTVRSQPGPGRVVLWEVAR